ncbi:hypothetical protein, partial [Variovorax beijingensis]|uniref:hypothetical protein n=1 Tax=Variovorax beijingensis TaxID=2496117 RepID=UPI001CB8C446
RFSAGEGLDAFASLASESDDVHAAASMLRTMMKASGMSIKDVARLVSSGVQPKPSESFLLSTEV